MREILFHNTVYLFAVLASILAILLLVTAMFVRKISRQSQQLQINEQYYKSLFEHNPDIIITFDVKGHFLNANKAVSLFGYTVEDLIHKSFVPLLIPKDVEPAMNKFRKAVSGEVSTYECTIFDKEGNQKDIQATNIPIYENNKIIGVYGIIKDITDHKMAQKNLIEAEAKYRSLVENSLVGVYILQNQKLMYVNPRICEITGYGEEELLDLDLANLINPKDFSLVIENLTKLLTNQESTITSQYRIIRKDKSVITLEIYGSSIEYNGQTAVIGTVIDVTERLKTEKMIKHMAYHDQLTGLPNRYLLREKINGLVKRSSEKQGSFALLFLDLDRFKAVNDRFGHEVGDKLLIEIAHRLKRLVNDNDMISRYGGDEFTILLSHTNVDRARDVAQSILTHLSEPFLHEIFVTPSIGISIFPDHGETFDSLIKKADLAMYFAKSLGKNNFQIFTDNLNEESTCVLELESQLRKALQRQEFILFYQPQINLETNQMVGAEALIRWNHPEKGLIAPYKFIPLAEESGLIIPIGEWAIRTACQQNKKWQEEGLPPITIAVNISARQFFQSNLPDVVRKILQETELEPKYLEIEITESMTMDVETAITTLNELKKIGVTISIDDFGTGYSSLNYLKRFPIDRLKIDQSFIHECTNDINDQTIIKTVILMAHLLKLQVIAEGVETKEQAAFLLQQNCMEAQGYYFSKPVPVEELEKYLIGSNKN
ncbi:sensor domain-containing protein [Neobacillus drentensis]|uniref:sensor domain-containing protein n=1 Tax=Neobacillus drentensis TaxID=220684 RepID=UPI002FFFB22C